MRFLNDKEREVLHAFCDTIQPHLEMSAGRLRNGSCAGHADADKGNSPFDLSASELGVIELVERALSEKDETARKRLRLLLKLLQRRVVNGVLAGHWAPFTRLTPQQRTDVLLAMANSPFNELRGAFHGVKQLVSFLSYSSERTEAGNPFWEAFNYEGRARCNTVDSDELPIVTIDRAQTISCDVLVIGSGAGGGVVAAELAAAGLDVVVVEKGDYFSNSRLPETELDGMRKLYESSGSLRTADRAMVVLAGSTLGGGTTVNWMTCLRPPELLLEQWASEFGFREALSAEFASSIDRVSDRVNVNVNESHANVQNDALERGCRALGYAVSVIPRNVNGCVKCDFCSYGCRYGAKQDTRRTFLQDAVGHGARIIVRAHVDKLTQRYGTVTGANVTVKSPAGHTYAVHVKCDRVVVAAGAVNSPAILLRSGLTNRNIGANLFLHPVGAVFARYAEPVEAWKGPPQTRLCDEFANLDGLGYGVRMEASPAHPGLWALGLPWQGGKRFRQLMEQIPHLANTIVLTRDRFSGHVTLNPQGKPVLNYTVHPYDARHLMIGLEKAIRVHRAAGAEVVFGPNNDCLSFDCQGRGDFEKFLQRVHAAGSRPNHLGLFCAHQMSSCRMASTPAKGAINLEGESYDLKNLYVADGSALPTSTGVNPMVTILSLAHFTAQQIKSRLPR